MHREYFVLEKLSFFIGHMLLSKNKELILNIKGIDYRIYNWKRTNIGYIARTMFLFLPFLALSC